jgi:hypothetical protein
MTAEVIPVFFHLGRVALIHLPSQPLRQKTSLPQKGTLISAIALKFPQNDCSTAFIKTHFRNTICFLLDKTEIHYASR